MENKIVVSDVTKIYRIYDNPTDQFLEAFSLTKKLYHMKFYALSNISLEVKKGEIVGIMGRNGAGKSTLLKIITGVLKPTYGSISINGRISSLLELGAGFNVEYTGLENIFFYGTIMGLSKQEIENRIQDIVEFAEIGDYIYQPVKMYSSGMFARLAFSCAINVDPEVLIVDEILSVGDIRFQAKCFKKFKEFKKRGVTILYVGHDIGTMRTFCDRCIWMDKGKIVDSGDPAYISAKYTEFMYLDENTSFTDYETVRHRKTKSEEIDEYFDGVNSEEIESHSEKEILKENDLDLFDNKSKSGEPIAHWGREIGCINEISMTAGGRNVNSFEPMEVVDVEFTILYHDNIDYENLSAAISIKNREGIDLIVHTTFDEDICFGINLEKRDIKVRFSFNTRLTNGSYYLVVALEDRSQAIISYYEYIEGAKYFKVFQPKELYGVFFTDMKVKIE